MRMYHDGNKSGHIIFAFNRIVSNNDGQFETRARAQFKAT